MKKYLIACNLGDDIVKSYVVEMDDGYKPSSDDMQALKEAVVKVHKPHGYHSYAAPVGSENYMASYTKAEGEIKPENLQILAVSNLEL